MDSTAKEPAFGLKWECRECHRLISDSETVAYHLINRILYGWCESCYGVQHRQINNCGVFRSLDVAS